MYYAVYDKNEELCFVGSASECAKFLNITLGSFYSRITRQKNGQIKGLKYYVYSFDDNEENE